MKHLKLLIVVLGSFAGVKVWNLRQELRTTLKGNKEYNTEKKLYIDSKYHRSLEEEQVTLRWGFGVRFQKQMRIEQSLKDKEDWDRKRQKGVPKRCPQAEVWGQAGGPTTNVQGTMSSAMWLELRCLEQGKE